MKKVTIVNYGIGNLLSVQRALKYCGAEVLEATTLSEVLRADRLVVPGVGAFQKCMEAIERHDLRQALIDFAKSGRPYLGICVGMQMLMTRSFEFGVHSGLNLIDGDVKKIEVPGFNVPFIGWKTVKINEIEEKYYFVHSYHANPIKSENVLATYDLGANKIVAAVKKGNVTGVQFHPEKSGEPGIAFLEKFLSK